MLFRKNTERETVRRPWRQFSSRFSLPWLPLTPRPIRSSQPPFRVKSTRRATQDSQSLPFASWWCPRPYSVRPQTQSPWTMLRSEHLASLTCFADSSALQKGAEAWGTTLRSVVYPSPWQLLEIEAIAWSTGPNVFWFFSLFYSWFLCCRVVDFRYVMYVFHVYNKFGCLFYCNVCFICGWCFGILKNIEWWYF